MTNLEILKQITKQKEELLKEELPIGTLIKQNYNKRTYLIEEIKNKEIKLTSKTTKVNLIKENLQQYTIINKVTNKQLTEKTKIKIINEINKVEKIEQEQIDFIKNIEKVLLIDVDEDIIITIKKDTKTNENKWTKEEILEMAEDGNREWTNDIQDLNLIEAIEDNELMFFNLELPQIKHNNELKEKIIKIINEDM